ncbi:MAG: glycosyltransferase family 4 protein [Terriglobales bacterium]
MKVLYISHYFPPEIGAPAARVSELSRHWVSEGHEVTVLTGFPNHPTGVIPQAYRHKFRRLVIREDVDGIKVVRTWLLPFPNRKPYERILNYSSFFLSSVATGLFLPRPDIVIATSPQLLVGLTGWWLAHCKRVPFIFEVRDLWPESLTAVGMGDANSPLHQVLGKIAGFLYRHCDRIVVVTCASKDHLIEKWRVPPEKISIFKNGVETDLFSPAKSSPTLRTELGVEKKVVIGYIGTIGLAHGLETLLQAADELQKSSPRILFLIVGEGADKERIRESAAAQRLDNVRFVGQQPRDRIPEFILACDMCLVLLKNTEVFKTVIPTKMLEFMSCERPVIVGVDGEARRIVEHAHAGIFIEPENVVDLVRAAHALAADSSLRESLGRNGRGYILRHFSRRQTARKYSAVLEAFKRYP